MRYGFDIGGTKIEIIALDGEGRERLRRRVPTPSNGYSATVECVKDLLESAEREFGAGTVGVAIPGALSAATGRVKNANSTWLNGRPLDRDLSTALGRPVRLANDANCFALSEAADGAGAGKHVVFGVILGTGVGGGIVVGGQPLTGPNSIAGEWGHGPLPWPTDRERPGPECYCGKFGCIETFLSGPGLARDHGGGTPEDIVRSAGDGETASGDKARDTLARYQRRLAKSLATVINVVDPDIIVLGGGLSNISGLYRHVPALWGEFVFSDRVETPLVKAEHGDSSGVRGAAWLWPAAKS